MAQLTKFDNYDYEIKRYPSGRPYMIKLNLESTLDPALPDIAAGLLDSDNRGYVDGIYFDVVDTLLTDDEFGTNLRLSITNVK